MVDVRSAITVPAPSSDSHASTKKYVDDNAGGGSSNLYPVLWYALGVDDSTAPTGIPDLTAESGPTLVDGDHVAGGHKIWSVHSGSWTAVHTYTGGEIFYVTSGLYNDIQSGLMGIYTPDAGVAIASNALVSTAIAGLGLGSLADVNLAGFTTGDLFAYDAGTAKWVPLSVLVGATPTAGDTIRSDGAGNWTFGP